MTEATRIKNKLEKFGLTNKQAELYVLLLRQGSLRINEITRTLQAPRSSVYETLRGLFELGLAEEIVENSYKKIRAYPIGTLKHVVDEKITKLQKQTEDLDYLEKALDILPGIPAPPPTIIRYYKGVAGARQLFWNTLKAQNTMFVYSEWGRGRYVGIEFYKRFVAESFKRGFEEKVITNATSGVMDSMRQHTGSPISRTDLSNIRNIDRENIHFKGDTLMYNNIYAQVFLKNDEITGFEIESQQFVDTQRAIFEKLWETAQPVTELL